LQARSSQSCTSRPRDREALLASHLVVARRSALLLTSFLVVARCGPLPRAPRPGPRRSKAIPYAPTTSSALARDSPAAASHLDIQNFFSDWIGQQRPRLTA
jgi:hypothetical protein